MSSNGISTLPTKQERQEAKLALAETKRQAASTIGYRTLNVLDTTLLPTVYVGNDISEQSHPDGLILGRPWTPAP